MPWEVSGVVGKRRQFLAEYASGDWTMTDLCCAYGISRPTGYALWKRYHVEGDAGRQDRSRAPRRHPNQTAAEIEAAELQLRRQHPRRGPRTLRRILQREEPEGAWPTASTVGGMLDREGLTRHRPKRRKTEPYTRPFASVQEPNDSWCADFKGWFRTGDGERIDPLTITDSCSRYLLRCQAVAKTDTERTKAIFEAAFREYGMPRVIRTDNGAPFASCAIAGFIAVGGVVDEVGHRAGADRAGASRTERTARADASHAEGSDGLAAGRQPAGTTSVHSPSSGASTTRCVRIRDWPCRHRVRCTGVRRERIRRGCRSRNTEPLCKCARFTNMAGFPGTSTRSFSAKCCGASAWACCRWTITTIGCTS
jgi:transposase